MTDDKTDRLRDLTGEYADLIARAYDDIIMLGKEWKREIPPEQAQCMAVSAFIGARDTIYPRYSSSGRGHGRGSGEKTYKGGNWDDKITEGQLKRLKWMKGKLETHFFENLKDTVGAKETAAETVKIMWAEKFDNEVPESVNDWTKGNCSWIMDGLQQRFKELFPEKKEGAK